MMSERKEQAPLPEVTFSTFVLSLASSALVHLGEVPNPESGTTSRDDDLARHAIDLLTMLDDKTRNGLAAKLGFTPEQIGAVQDMFRIIFQEGRLYGKACDLVMEQFPQSRERDLVVEFIRSSKRGIIKPFNPNASNDE
jgi:hypothetical protein